jgi:hypothetical protein
MDQTHFFGVPFLESLMQRHAPDDDIRVLRAEPLPVDNSASILAVLTAGITDKPIGHFGLSVTYSSRGEVRTEPMVMKLKPHGREIVEMLNSLAQACGGKLAEVYPAYKWLTGFGGTHVRELDIYGIPCDLHPRVYGLHASEEQETYAILMEYLQEVELLNSVMSPAHWSDAHIRQALRQVAAWHARHLGAAPPARDFPADDMPSAAYMLHLVALWEALLDNAAGRFPELYTPSRVKRMEGAIETLASDWQELEKMPRTWIHNDLNPRNTCFRDSGNGLQFCVYDWELATCHVPQYDVVELLCFVLDHDRHDLRPGYLEFYRLALHDLTGQFADAQTFRRGFVLAARHFGLHRLGLYMMGHSVSPYPFLPRVVNSYFDTLQQAESR